LKNCIDLSKLENIVEIGCGAGGILVPFKEIGKTVSGCDFDKDYLEYGKQKGLNLIYGSSDQIQNNSADLVILSHVMEHLLHPIDEMKAIIGKIKPEKYILVEVPGIFRIANAYFNPILYFLNAHYYYYYYYYLRVFFTQLGLKVLYGDEQCTVICQKPKDWNSEKTPSIIYDDSLQAYPQKVANYLIRCKRIDRILFNASKLHLHEIACKFGWKKIRPYFLKKYRYEK
ncbi:MAG: class I SAM-dependent methyltransferase, partial [Prevotellaceae bacterium]|nr:class I SAM-dependent methyltransferase [Prevotellaceae bacterium]